MTAVVKDWQYPCKMINRIISHAGNSLGSLFFILCWVLLEEMICSPIKAAFGSGAPQKYETQSSEQKKEHNEGNHCPFSLCHTEHYAG